MSFREEGRSGGSCCLDYRIDGLGSDSEVERTLKDGVKIDQGDQTRSPLDPKLTEKSGCYGEQYQGTLQVPSSRLLGSRVSCI